LINDVLDLSKIEAGKMELAFEDEINLADIIKGVMSTTVGLVKDKPVALKQEIDPELPLLSIDPMKIRQVLLNLLSNAAKFTEEGSITVNASVQVREREKPEVLVQIIDTGAGIAPEDQVKLFQPFSQVDGSLTRKTGGSGLGLSICHHLVRLHGGRIGLESEVGNGSNFYFTLPIDRSDVEIVDEFTSQPELPTAYSNQQEDDKQVVESTPEIDTDETIEKATQQAQTLDDKLPDGKAVATEEPSLDASPSPQIAAAPDESEVVQISDDLPPAEFMTGAPPSSAESAHSGRQAIQRSGASPQDTSGVVVTIEQDHQLTDLYRRYLSNYNFTAIALTELDQAVTVVRGIQPVAITLDVAMVSDKSIPSTEKSKEIPAPDGWQILKLLKTDPNTKNIPVIVCSLLDQREKALELGASEYLLKPILEDDLIRALQRFC
jgi:CheY-like chemotaxis protein